MDLVATSAAAFVAAGFIKGLIGFGFPIVALTVLTLAIGFFDALAMILVPTIVTNIWQALAGPYFREIVSRMWLYFVVAMGGILLSSLFVIDVDVNWLTGLLGFVLLVFAISRLLNVEISVPREHESLWSVVLGFINGILTGFTGSFMVPSVLYMQALGFNKDMLVQAMGTFFALSTLMLTVSLGHNGLVTTQDATLSTLALVPSFAGIYAGRWTRTRIDESRFQTVFLVAMIMLGTYIVWRSFATFR